LIPSRLVKTDTDAYSVSRESDHSENLANKLILTELNSLRQTDIDLAKLL